MCSLKELLHLVAHQLQLLVEGGLLQQELLLELSLLLLHLSLMMLQQTLQQQSRGTICLLDCCHGCWCWCCCHGCCCWCLNPLNLHRHRCTRKEMPSRWHRHRLVWLPSRWHRHRQRHRLVRPLGNE